MNVVITYADVPSKECKACHGDYATCVGAENVDCTKCKTGNSKYLKVLDAEDGSGQCVATEEECKSEATYFLVTDTNANTKTCYPCEASSRGGVTNCLTCTASGTAATATCTACRNGYTLDSQANTCVSSSTNKSGLSTGAIAGISVAVSCARIGQVPRLLPSLDVRAVSQARSPESNPDSPPGVGPSVRCAVVPAPRWSCHAHSYEAGSTVNTR